MRVSNVLCGGRVTNHRGSTAFTLIELLTVVFIITLLIGILVPALNGARNMAKKTSTKATISAIGTSLDLFRGDNEREFSATNGYPPSFSHPRMLDSSGSDLFDRFKGECPFIKDKPVISGAHWLPMMLMGLDQEGYVKRSTVPRKDDMRDKPWLWYDPDALGTGKRLDRQPFYADPGNLKTKQTKDIGGHRNDALFEENVWTAVKNLPVIIDAFGTPILYFAANANGTTNNMLEDERDENNEYTGGVQQEGPPVYFHQDNHMFTGTKNEKGWDFDGPHVIAACGSERNADELSDPDNLEAANTFARYILDRTLLRTLRTKREAGETISESTPLRPVNADSYLLMSPGVDGVWGTRDDVTNFTLELE